MSGDLPPRLRNSPAKGRRRDGNLFIVEYETQDGSRFHTTVEALTVECARRQFVRDNPHVLVLSVQV